MTKDFVRRWGAVCTIAIVVIAGFTLGPAIGAKPSEESGNQSRPYYTKEQADELFALTSETYSKADADSLFALSADVYTKTQADGTFAKVGDSYTKSQSDRRYPSADGDFTVVSGASDWELHGNSDGGAVDTPEFKLLHDRDYSRLVSFDRPGDPKAVLSIQTPTVIFGEQVYLKSVELCYKTSRGATIEAIRVEAANHTSGSGQVPTDQETCATVHDRLVALDPDDDAYVEVSAANVYRTSNVYLGRVTARFGTSPFE